MVDKNLIKDTLEENTIIDTRITKDIIKNNENYLNNFLREPTTQQNIDYNDLFHSGAMVLSVKQENDLLIARQIKFSDVYNPKPLQKKNGDL